MNQLDLIAGLVIAGLLAIGIEFVIAPRIESWRADRAERPKLQRWWRQQRR